MNSRRRQVPGFTLLELVVVVTLITLAVGWTTLDLHGVSDRAVLQTAATQIGAVQRTVAQAASTTGMPRKIVWDRRSCTVFRPVLHEGEWRWSPVSEFGLVKKVWLRNVNVRPGAAGKERSGPPWNVILTPGNTAVEYRFQLETTQGLDGAVIVDGFLGSESLRFEETQD